MKSSSVLPAVSIADHKPDAELLAFVRELKAQKKIIDKLERKVQLISYEINAAIPTGLRWRWKTDQGMPFDIKSHSMDTPYTKEEVNYIRSRRWDTCKRYTSGVTGARAQIRAKNIIHNFEQWELATIDHRSKIDKANVELTIAHKEISKLMHAIFSSKPTTLDGFKCKMKFLEEFLFSINSSALAAGRRR